MPPIFYAMLSYLFLLNLVTTWRVLRDDTADGQQKILQTFIIWGVPVLGAVITALMLNRTEPARREAPSLLLRMLAACFFVTFPVKRPGNYPSSLNDYGPTVGEGWWDGGCGLDGGACGGGE